MILFSKMLALSVSGLHLVVSKANSIRFYTLRYKLSSSSILSPFPASDRTMALHSTSHLIHLLSLLERRCRLRSVNLSTPLKPPPLTPTRRQNRTHSHNPPRPTPLHQPLHHLLLLSPAPPHLHTLPPRLLLAPPHAAVPSATVEILLRRFLYRHRALSNPLHHQVQHNHPPLHPSRQQTLHVLRVPLHNPASSICAVYVSTHLSGLWMHYLLGALYAFEYVGGTQVW